MQRGLQKIENEELLFTNLGGIRLRLEIDRVPLWRGNDVLLKQLSEDFAQYLYLPRLKNPDVLVDAVKGGIALITWNPEAFAYADGWDAAQDRYLGLRVTDGSRIALEGGGLLVKPEIAAKQFEADRSKVKDEKEKQVDSVRDGGQTPPIIEDGKPKVIEEKKFVRFYGSIELDATRLGRDAGKVAEEVVQHLSGLVGANVEITLDIHADIPDGAPDNVVRTVTENCRTLKFKTHGFEKE